MDRDVDAKNATVDGPLPAAASQLDLRLGRPTGTVPSWIKDREVAEAMWPLLLSGASIVALTGKTAVDLGLDSSTARARVANVIDELRRLRLVAGA